MDVKGNQMNSLDFNTRLPPRKRLLAGLKGIYDSDSSPLISSDSSDLCARLRDVYNLRTSSPEDIIEASRSAALAAGEVAAAARAAAMEKASVAAKAKAVARDALELLASFSSNEACEEFCVAKNKTKKKHVPINLLYKNNSPIEIRETDEELARRLHAAMNSSPRISHKSKKKHGGLSKERDSDQSVVSKGNLPVLCDGKVESSNGGHVDKIEDNCRERDGESRYSTKKYQHDSKARGAATGRKGKTKRKKLLLSQCNTREHGDPKEMRTSDCYQETGETKFGNVARNMPLFKLKPSSEGEVSVESPSMPNYNKLKVSHCSSDSKILRVLHASPAVTASSTVVKVD